MPKAKTNESVSQAALAAMGAVPKGHTRFLQVSLATKDKKASFWRAGKKHTSEPVTYPLEGEGAFDVDQVEALFTEPMLRVAYVDVKDSKGDDAAAQ